MGLKEGLEYNFLIKQIERVNDRADRLEREIKELKFKALGINVAKALTEMRNGGEAVDRETVEEVIAKC